MQKKDDDGETLLSTFYSDLAYIHNYQFFKMIISL